MNGANSGIRGINHTAVLQHINSGFFKNSRSRSKAMRLCLSTENMALPPAKNGYSVRIPCRF